MCKIYVEEMEKDAWSRFCVFLSKHNLTPPTKAAGNKGVWEIDSDDAIEGFHQFCQDLRDRKWPLRVLMAVS